MTTSGVALLSLDGKGIGLSGGGGHLGRALAIGLAQAGATVVAFGRSRDALLMTRDLANECSPPGRVLIETADAHSDDDVARVLDRLEESTGGIDGWVNNAFSAVPTPLGELDRLAVDVALSSGLTDVMVATRMVAERMRPRGQGSIVNVASMYAMVSPQPAMYRHFPTHHSPPAYGAAKAGVVQFTRYAACHLANHGIRVNCISPGAFPAPTVQRNAEFMADLVDRVPLGRIGRPEELVGPALLLLSDASSYITGHNLVVDGGWTSW